MLWGLYRNCVPGACGYALEDAVRGLTQSPVRKPHAAARIYRRSGGTC